MVGVSNLWPEPGLFNLLGSKKTNKCDNYKFISQKKLQASWVLTEGANGDQLMKNKPCQQ